MKLTKYIELIREKLSSRIWEESLWKHYARNTYDLSTGESINRIDRWLQRKASAKNIYTQVAKTQEGLITTRISWNDIFH